MPAQLCDALSFQNMTMNDSRWHMSPAILKKFMNMVAATGSGPGNLRADTRRLKSAAEARPYARESAPMSSRTAAAGSHTANA